MLVIGPQASGLVRYAVPLYDETNPQHQKLAELGHACGGNVATLDLDTSGNFVVLRRKVRTALANYPPAVEANELVVTLLSG